MKKIKTFKLFEANEFGDTGFKSDINHIKMIMSDIKDDGIDFKVIPGERDFPDEKDNIYIKIYNIPNDLKDQLDYFDRKYKQLIDEIGDLYQLSVVRFVKYNTSSIISYNSYDEFLKFVSDMENKQGWIFGKIKFKSIDFEFSSHDGKDIF
jgi:flagellin-specific chaperone FliS